MSEISNSSFGEYLDGDSLQIQRFLPGSIERVWQYLTDSDLRKRWLASGEMQAEEGSEFEFCWRNDELAGEKSGATSGTAVDAECAVEEHRMQSKITAWNPPHRLAFTWSNSGDVTIELEQRGDEVLLTLTHRQLPDKGTIVGVSSGWHAHLDHLLACLGETQPLSFWDNYNRLRSSYEERVAALD